MTCLNEPEVNAWFPCPLLHYPWSHLSLLPKCHSCHCALIHGWPHQVTESKYNLAVCLAGWLSVCAQGKRTGLVPSQACRSRPLLQGGTQGTSLQYNDREREGVCVVGDDIVQWKMRNRQKPWFGQNIQLPVHYQDVSQRLFADSSQESIP